MTNRVASFLAALTIASACALLLEVNYTFAQERVDRFEGTLVLRDYSGSESKKFELDSDLKYVDPNGREWYAWKGLITDGASIPWFLWSVVGSPFTGEYRRAAIIHDFYCAHHFRQWETVSRVFYDAMLTDGVNSTKASLMYYAVVRFGPRWTIKETETCPKLQLCANPGKLEVNVSTPSVSKSFEKGYLDEVESVRKYIDENHPNLAQLQSLAASKPPIPQSYSDENIIDNWNDNLWRSRE